MLRRQPQGIMWVSGSPAARSRAITRLLVTAGIACSISMPASAHAQRLQFSKLTTDDGVSGSWVPSIIQDSRGFMWFGTRRGLDRFDGNTINTYRHVRGDSNSLGDNYVEFLKEDRDSVIWVGTRKGVSRLDRAHETFKNYTVGPGEGGRPVMAMLHARSGTVWLGTDEGLYQFDRKTGASTRFAGSAAADLIGKSVSALLEDRRGHIWVGTTDAGLKDIDLSNGSVRAYKGSTSSPTGFPGADIRGLVEDDAGMLWVGAYRGGLVRLDPVSGAITRYRHDPNDPKSLAVDAIQTIALTERGGIWVGLENGGLDKFDAATNTFHHNRNDPNNPSGLTNNSIWSLYEDGSGTLWVGTFAGGINIAKRNSDAIRTYRAVPGDVTSLSANSVVGFAQDSSGAVWVATDGGGLNRFDLATGKFMQVTTKNSALNQDAVLGIAAEPSGVLWVGMWGGGVTRYDPRSNSFTSFTTRNSNIPGDDIFAMHLDRKGRLWAGSWNRGLLLFDRDTKSFTTFPITKPPVVAQEIWAIEELRDGRLALCTREQGLIIFDPESKAMTSFMPDPKDPNSIISAEVRAIYESEPGVLWLGTAEGLDKLDLTTKKVTHFTNADGIVGTAVSGIATDAEGNFWLSTDQGITRFNPAMKKGAQFTQADGLQGRDFNPRAYFRSRTGALLFGGNAGLSVIQPSQLAQNTRVPPVVLTGFQLMSKPVAIGAEGSPLETAIGETKTLTLSYKQSVFTFEFAALDYTAPAKNQYAYKLDGFDKEWREVGNQRTAVYTNLEPGKYTFHVKGTNNDGVWNETGASLDLVITPPFWKTWWFRLFLAAATAGAIWFVVRAATERRRNLERMNSQLAESAERDRTAQQYLTGNVREMLGAMSRFSEGDLSVALDVATDDEIGQLRGGFNTAVTNIRAMVLQVHEIVSATVSASRQIRVSTEALAEGAQQQIEQASLVATAAEQMSSVVADNARHIGVVAEMAQQSGRDAVEGGRVVRDTFASMDTIVSTVGRSATTVAALGKSSEEITKITRVIDQLADQTNLLALNAAIEAARAGKHGRTFAVVADEIRDLADRTSSSTQAITRVIMANEAAVKEAVASMGQVSGHLESGRQLVDRAGIALDSIIENSGKVLDSVKQVTKSSEEQAETTIHIGKNIETISRVTHEAASGNQSIASAVQEMSALIEDLQTRVARFHLGEESESQRELTEVG
ncbi:MAG TPA: two-component regulator propeller domain-containing protein [Gemmatimonadaceae bacterium]|nr:two-component regulator propeller domain-containing protein [Gemmatimonadaceae bacterium]